MASESTRRRRKNALVSLLLGLVASLLGSGLEEEVLSLDHPAVVHEHGAELVVIRIVPTSRQGSEHWFGQLGFLQCRRKRVFEDRKGVGPRHLVPL